MKDKIYGGAGYIFLLIWLVIDNVIETNWRPVYLIVSHAKKAIECVWSVTRFVRADFFGLNKAPEREL